MYIIVLVNEAFCLGAGPCRLLYGLSSARAGIQLSCSHVQESHTRMLLCPRLVAATGSHPPSGCRRWQVTVTQVTPTALFWLYVTGLTAHPLEQAKGIRRQARAGK